MSDNVKESIREAISDRESTDNVKKSIREVISDEVCTIHLYLLLKKNGQYKLKVADVEDVAAPELKSLFVSNLDSTIVIMVIYQYVAFLKMMKQTRPYIYMIMKIIRKS